MNEPLVPNWELLFVYGSLKRGLANHGQLADARFAGEASMPGIDLHDLGPFPMAVPGAGCAHGELYRVAPSQLVSLDHFEGVPRLYERHRLPLDDGRLAWIYLGRPQQVRHSPRLAAGRWPLLALLLALAPGLPPRSVHADANLAECQRWQRSSGLERILLGNAIGAAAYLTKVHRLAESDPQHPQLLYATSDLQRVCQRWR